ncbi:MAG: N-carbamoylputrescine amidase [Myxococcales bacterium]|nr:N-carbamoylputrescine amidase [Myxococcales bacterium]
MSSHVTVAALQSVLTDSKKENVERMDALVRQAASKGAQIVLIPELFEGCYFPQEQLEKDFGRALPAKGHATISHFQKLASELGIALPVSFYERDGQELYNSIAMIDADGSMLGIYRKSHIPDGPGYQEKFFFRPGNTGFKTWKTRFATIGVGICWDQWFPEAARSMVLAGADLLFYPTAIGCEPQDASLDTCAPWQRVMQGHAVANACGVVAANRTGAEGEIRFYGSSFICDQRGDMLAEMNRDESGFITATFDLPALRTYRDSFGFFRDRRPTLYP